MSLFQNTTSKHWLVLGLLTMLIFSTELLSTEKAAASVNIEQISKTEFRLTIDGAELEISIRDRILLSKKDILLDWINYSAKTVHQYYGRFPVDKARVELNVSGGFAVRFGQAFGGDDPYLKIVVGEDINQEMLRKDWIIVHEMIHLAMADVPHSNRWLLEGLATYVESIARAQQGHLSEEFVWNGFLSRMPQGLPVSGDKGLDYTPTWGRTYWGGAIFCLLADVEIRKLTDNRMSLRDALRGILKAGYSMKASATPMQIFEAADKATGVPVMVNLYQEMRANPTPADLEDLWRDLGVSLEGEQVVYNDEAPLTQIRQQLLRP